ncbi:MAG: class I SAM-dependent methyltransferase [Candidatus Thorarchaeota archaeon]
MENLTDSIRNSGVLKIRDRLSSVSGGRVLDVGTQHGDFITTLMKSMNDYESFVGIDISEADLEKAKEAVRDGSVSFELMNGEQLTFDDATFDTVCLSYSIHHLEKVNAVLEEIVRVLRPGGHLLIQEMFSDGNQNNAQHTETLTHHLDAKLDRLEGIPHYDTYSRKHLMDLVHGLGMSNVEVFESSWGLHCIFCDDSQRCEDPRSEYNLETGREQLEKHLQRAKSIPGAENLEHEAKQLMEQLESTGYKSASILFFICEK